MNINLDSLDMIVAIKDIQDVHSVLYTPYCQCNKMMLNWILSLQYSLSGGILISCDKLGKQDNKQREWPLSAIIATLSISRGGA